MVYWKAVRPLETRNERWIKKISVLCSSKFFGRGNKKRSRLIEKFSLKLKALEIGKVTSKGMEHKSLSGVQAQRQKNWCCQFMLCVGKQ